MNEINDEQKLTVPGAIVAAGIIIALAIVYTSGSKAPAVTVAPTAQQNAATEKANLAKLAENVLPVSASDHLLGNPNAPIKMIEFTDIECPYCKKFQPELEQIMSDAKYGKTGQVAWVLRHFPLVSRHPEAMPASIASECVFNQLGEIKFWDYIHTLFTENLTNTESDAAIFANDAVKLGANLKKFNECLTSKQPVDKIEANIQDALNAGVQGTPYTILITASGKHYPINGAVEYAELKAIIDLALKDK